MPLTSFILNSPSTRGQTSSLSEFFLSLKLSSNSKDFYLCKSIDLVKYTIILFSFTGSSAHTLDLPPHPAEEHFVFTGEYYFPVGCLLIKQKLVAYIILFSFAESTDIGHTPRPVEEQLVLTGEYYYFLDLYPFDSLYEHYKSD